MNSGLYAAFTGLSSRAQAFDLAANNLANLSTPGYKAQREFYQSMVAASGGRNLGPLNQAINNFGVLGGGSLDLRPGNIELTGNDLDLAVEGPGFFTVQTAAGVRYSRNGSFHLSSAGQMVTQDGDPVLGDQGRPIELPTGPVSISPDGTISVNGTIAARLQLAEFDPDTQLQPQGSSYFAAPPGAALDPIDSRILQGSLEASNMDAATGGVTLIALQRQVEMLQRALEMFHSEFNRIAAEDLGRV